MLHRNSLAKATKQAGFTLIELLVVMALIGLLSSMAYGFFSGTFSQYFSLQKDGSNFTELAGQSQRISNVVRGATDIIAATPDDLTIYGYFSPADAYVSKIHYYKNAGGTELLADVTRMTSNPPIGVPIDSSLKTYTVISDLHQSGSTSLFTYLDDSRTPLSMPIADLRAVKSIRIELAVPTSNPNADQAMAMEVTLRNRKDSE